MLIGNLFSVLKKRQHIWRLFKKRQYAFLFAFHRNNLPLFKEGIVICHLKLFRLFLIEPKWNNSIFFVIGLVATGRFETAKEKLHLLQKYASNQFIMSFFSSYFPEVVKSIYEKNGKTESLFFASLCATLKDFKKLNQALKINSRKIKKNPHYFLLKNFLEDNEQERLDNLNQFLQYYDLEPIVLSRETNKQFVCRLKNIRHITGINNPNTAIVTILVTNYNTQDYIESTLLSLLEQSYSNIEIIVIDDCSTDDSCNIIEKLAQKDSRIKLITLKNNVGTYVAKNIGMSYAQGEFITCHDSDDWAHPRKIELQLKPLLENTQLVATFSKWIRLDSEGLPYTRYIYPLLRLNPSSALFRREEIEENIGLWDCVRVGADSEFNTRLQLSFGSDKYYIINKPLTLGSHRNNSLMTNVDTGYINGFSAQREQYSFAWNCWHVNQLKQNKKLKLPLYPICSFYKNN